MKRHRFGNLVKYSAILLLFLLTILVIIIGEIHFDDKSKQKITTATTTTAVQAKETNHAEEKDVTPLTILEYLVSESKQYGSARISVLGSSIPKNSSVPKEKTWIVQLQTDLKANTKGLEQLSYMVTDYNVMSTKQIIDSKQVETIGQQIPTVVLFETGVLNDFRQNIPFETSATNLEEIMNQFQDKVPNARVILLLPNRGSDVGSNKLGLKAKDYIDKAKELSQSKGWNYIDLYEGFENQRVKNGRALTQVLLTDGYNPNVIGNKYIYNTVKEYLMK